MTQNTHHPPNQSLLTQLSALSPAELQDHVKNSTSLQLENLINEMDNARDVPEAFAQVGVQREISQMLDHLQSRIEVKTKWETVKDEIKSMVPSRSKLQRAPQRGASNMTASTPTTASPPEAPKNGFDSLLDKTLPENWTQAQKRTIAMATIGGAVLLGAVLIWGRRSVDAGNQAAAQSEGGFMKKLLVGGLVAGGVFLGVDYVLKNFTGRGLLKRVGMNIKEGGEDIVKDGRDAIEDLPDRLQDIPEQTPEGLRQAAESEMWRTTAHDLIFFYKDIAQSKNVNIRETTVRQKIGALIANEDFRDKTVGNILGNTEENMWNKQSVQSDERQAAVFLKAVIAHKKNDVQQELQQGKKVEDMSVEEFLSNISLIAGILGSVREHLSSRGLITNVIGSISGSKEGILNAATESLNGRHSIEKATNESGWNYLIEDYPQLDANKTKFFLFAYEKRNEAVKGFSSQDTEEQIYISAINTAHGFVKEKSAYLEQYTHQDDRFQDVFQRSMKELTVGETMKLFTYLHLAQKNGEMPEDLQETNATAGLFLQLSVLNLIKDRERETGWTMEANLLNRVLKEGSEEIIPFAKHMKPMVGYIGGIAYEQGTDLLNRGGKYSKEIVLQHKTLTALLATGAFARASKVMHILRCGNANYIRNYYHLQGSEQSVKTIVRHIQALTSEFRTTAMSSTLAQTNPISLRTGGILKGIDKAIIEAKKTGEITRGITRVERMGEIISKPARSMGKIFRTLRNCKNTTQMKKVVESIENIATRTRMLDTLQKTERLMNNPRTAQFLAQEGSAARKMGGRMVGKVATPLVVVSVAIELMRAAEIDAEVKKLEEEGASHRKIEATKGRARNARLMAIGTPLMFAHPAGWALLPAQLFSDAVYEGISEWETSQDEYADSRTYNGGDLLHLIHENSQGTFSDTAASIAAGSIGSKQLSRRALNRSEMYAGYFLQTMRPPTPEVTETEEQYKDRVKMMVSEQVKALHVLTQGKYYEMQDETKWLSVLETYALLRSKKRHMEQKNEKAIISFQSHGREKSIDLSKLDIHKNIQETLNIIHRYHVGVERRDKVKKWEMVRIAENNPDFRSMCEIPENVHIDDVMRNDILDDLKHNIYQAEKHIKEGAVIGWMTWFDETERNVCRLILRNRIQTEISIFISSGKEKSISARGYDIWLDEIRGMLDYESQYMMKTLEKAAEKNVTEYQTEGAFSLTNENGKRVRADSLSLVSLAPSYNQLRQ